MPINGICAPATASPTPCSTRKPEFVIITSVDKHDNPVPQAVVADSIIGVLGQTQTAPSSQSGTPSSTRDPLGELVSANLELVGLRGQPVLLAWSIFQQGDKANPFGKWLGGDFVVDRLEATTNDDTTALEMWIPLPKLPGPFVIRLSLSTDGADLASADSSPFD
jgi:hypothetical protein